MSLTSGTKLGPYEILSPLGAGGMGEVYRARDTRLGREVALKVLSEFFARDFDRLRRFEQEARAVAALNHPNILAIHDIGEHDGVPYLVSELLEGCSLHAELSRGPLTPRKASDYAAQIARGLAAAHDKNIVHRDLKPDNVFITKDGRVKILDFGLAKVAPSVGAAPSEGDTLASSPTEAGVVMGTAGYMAPEQVHGAAVDSRTDIFAFGAMLYEMISGQRAFRRDTAAETMTAILKDDPPELSEIDHPVSPGMERIVRRCLEKQPEQRFQSAKDLAFALEALTGTSSKSAPNVAIADIKERAARASWITTGAISVLSLVLGAAIVWFLRPKPLPPPEFKRVSFHRGEVVRARMVADGKTVIYSAKLNGGDLDTYIIRNEYPESSPLGLHGASLLSISPQGQLAVLVHPRYFAHFQWVGTLATVPLGGGAPRELLEHVGDADWSPDGSELAIIDRDQKQWRLQYPVGNVLLQGGNWLSDLRLSPDGKQIAIFRHPPNVDDRGDVLLIDRSGKVRAVSPGWESLEGMAWAPSGKEVWFSAAEAGEQYCIRAMSLSGKQRTVNCGTSPTRIHDITSSGRSLVSTEEHQVKMALAEHSASPSSSEERDLSWLDSPYGPSLSADGGEVLFTDQSGEAGNQYGVYVRKTDGSPAVRIGGGGFATDLSADGKWALILLPGDPAAQVQIVPVGPGQPTALHWDGFQPLWATWFPDGQRILLLAGHSGQSESFYITDRNGSVPKLVGPCDGNSDIRVAPDGQSFFLHDQGRWMVRPIGTASNRPIPRLQSDEFPIAWTSDSKHVFTQTPTPDGLAINNIDLNSGQRELWQIIKPKDQVGLNPMITPIAITPDGRWMAYHYGTQLGQLYRSDNLK